MKRIGLKKLLYAAVCAALGLVLPIAFHLFGGTGPVFLPMHLPVLLCGFAAGPLSGAIVGLLVPLLSSISTGMPPLYPTGVIMMLELCTYGLTAGLFFKRFGTLLSLVLAMLAGRAVSGLASAILYGVMGKAFGLTAFLTGAFVTGLPGIAVQLLVLPLIVTALRRSGQIAGKR